MATATGIHAGAGHDELQYARIASAANVVAGLWLIAAPFVLNFQARNDAQWNHVIVGAAVAVIALIRGLDPDHREGLSWVNFALGLWMIVAPFVLTYRSVNDAQTSSIVTGIIIAALSAFSAYETRRAHREEAEARSTQ